MFLIHGVAACFIFLFQIVGDLELSYDVQVFCLLDLTSQAPVKYMLNYL